MKSKAIWGFVIGVAVTLIVAAGTGYLRSRLHPAPPKGGMEMEGTAGMDMGAMETDSGAGPGAAQAAVMISPARRQLIGVKTDRVEARDLETTLRTVGTVDYDERRIRQIHLRISGWITDLSADYTGKPVMKGDPLFTLYSPDLLSSQEEYLLAQRTLERVGAGPVARIREAARAQLESARNRLLRWDFSEAQVAALEARQKPEQNVTIHSPMTGVVIEKSALGGMYVTPEMELFRIADLSTVWVYADLYEYESPMVTVGQEAVVTLAAYPGEEFRGRVIYLYPYLNTETRTVKIRMEFPNPGGRLKPGMYGNVMIRTKAEKALAIRMDAVIDSGIRKLVFVDQGRGMYEPREVTVGAPRDGFYPVRSGLNGGETVVTSATFLIDSESKLMAAANMMGMLGMGGIRMEQARMGEMEMGGMPMGDMKGMKGMETAQGSTGREQTVDGLTLHLSTMPDPPKKGENMIHLIVRFKEGPVTDAQVTLGYTMAMPGMGIETVEAKHSKDGTYEATVDLGMKGGWNIDATVVRGRAKPVKTRFTIEVK